MNITQITAEDLIKKLKLVPHIEGSYFVETYRSSEKIPKSALPSYYPSDRAFSTAIYYLLKEKTMSCMHRIQMDEVYHFYLGDPIEMLLLPPNGPGKVITLGQNLFDENTYVQFTVPRLYWQGFHLKKGGKIALIGTTCAPGFEYADFEAGKPSDLALQYPGFKDLIFQLSLK